MELHLQTVVTGGVLVILVIIVVIIAVAIAKCWWHKIMSMCGSNKRST